MVLACLTDGQPIGGDQDHGHSTEMWELGWSNPRAGLFYAPWQGRTQLRWVDTLGICSPNLSWVFHLGVYPYRRIATPSYILVWGCCQVHLISFILVRQRGQPVVLVLIYLEIWSSMIEELSGILIGVPALLR